MTLVAAVSIGALWVHAVADTKRTCELDPGDLAPAWDWQRRTAVETAVRTVGGDVARIDASLDGYAASWLDERRAACEATVVRGVVSESERDARDRASIAADASSTSSLTCSRTPIAHSPTARSKR